MKLRHLRIHNFRSIIDADVEVHDYLMVVGANNAGKSNFLAGLRAFYEDIKWSGEDFPKTQETGSDAESWVELTYELDDAEWQGLADSYKTDSRDQRLTVRRYFVSKDRVKTNQSNIYAIIDGVPQKDLFYGAKNVGMAKLGHLIYIPALTTAADQMKTTGPSPLRDMLSFMFKRAVSGSQAYKEVESAFGRLNEEARGVGGFLGGIVNPINEAIKPWGIRFDMSINTIAPDDITKSLIRHGFADTMLEDAVMTLDRYGHGFQRSFLYELIKLAPSFAEAKKGEKKEFDPEFTLILFEEPEAFLHPAQQENMAYHLRRLGKGGGQQVIVTSHSPIFVGKVADDLCQIVRVRREKGVSSVRQVTRDKVKEVMGAGLGFKKCLQDYVNDPNISDDQKCDARKLLKGSEQTEDMAHQEERFRYQLWLDSDRSSMFFADRVLLVEGATEKALFGWLWAHSWHDLSEYRIAVVDVLGKYNFHRFIALLEGFGIPYGLILDDDDNKMHHKAVNEMLRNKSEPCRLAEPVFLEGCMEKFLGKSLPNRDDKKPVQILRELEGSGISEEKLRDLKGVVLKALALGEIP